MTRWPGRKLRRRRRYRRRGCRRQLVDSLAINSGIRVICEGFIGNPCVAPPLVVGEESKRESRTGCGLESDWANWARTRESPVQKRVVEWVLVNILLTIS